MTTIKGEIVSEKLRKDDESRKNYKMCSTNIKLLMIIVTDLIFIMLEKTRLCIVHVYARVQPHHATCN